MSLNSPHAPITYTFRLWCIIYGISLSTLCVVLRLICLQIIAHDDLFQLSTKNFLRTETTVLPRGNILDCTGNLLATNRPVTAVYWQGTAAKRLSESQKAALEVLAPLIYLSYPAILTTISHVEKRGARLLLADDITFEQLSKITERFPNHPNIILETHHKRFYPYGHTACHILGHIHKIDMQFMGKMGLEKIFQEQLSGKPGLLLKKINSLGCGIEYAPLQQALAGQNIFTTLDLSLQLIAERIFPEDQTGVLILLNAKNGAIQALVSRPHFDPMLFLDAINQEDWQALQGGNRFLNRAFDACYPPASLFKLVTISAALEHNIVALDDTVLCKGYFRFGNRRYHCGRQYGHGILDICESVSKSCNILFYDIATKLSIDLLAEYAYRFGLGSKTGLIFSEKSGLVPTKQWKLQEKGEPWWPGETVPCVIGQGPLLVTPIQIACMISSIFEGYLVKPRILRDEECVYKPLPIGYNTRQLLKKSMKLAAKKGTGKILHTIPGMKIYAKTGTAQTHALALQKKEDPSTQPHSWFVVYFIYEDQDPLTLVILVERGGSSRVTSRLAKQFLLEYKKSVDYKKHNSTSNQTYISSAQTDHHFLCDKNT